MVRCPDCQAEVSEWAAHCPACGADVTTAGRAAVGDGVAVLGGRTVPPGRADELEHLDPFDEVQLDESPPGGGGSVEAPPLRRGRGPVGAIAVAVIAAGAIVLVALGRHGHPAAVSRPTPRPTPATAAVTVTVPPVLPPVTSGVAPEPLPYTHLVDLTWISDVRGFALISANCPAGSCAMILTTSDGGQSWTRGGNVPDVSLGAGQVCVASCFQHLRYASPTVGYLWGQAGLYLTVDGGQTWASQPGQIAALEAVPPGWAVRVSASGGIPAPFEVDRAPVGSAQWMHLPTQVGSFGASIFTAGKYLYIAWGGHTAGATPDAHTSFVRSVDGGATWQSFGDPCGRTSDGSELDATTYAASPNGDLAVLCTPRLVNGTLWYAESVDSGDHFGALQPVPVESGETVELALAHGGQVALVAATHSGSTEVIRSPDGGRSWATVLSAPPATEGGVLWLGFEDETTGRVSFGDPQLWTTTDSGLTWTAEQVPTSA